MCIACDVNPGRAEAFAGRMLEIINQGCLAIMISIGHRSKLFDVMSSMQPATSQDIAGAAGLNERYVREWLKAMAVGKVITVDEAGTHYSLPAEHAHSLVRLNPESNMATFAQYVGVLSSVEDKILHCFKNGGGVPYSEYDRFHEVMAEDSGQSVLPALFTSILPLVPGLVEKLEKGIKVLDVGCGSGRALNRMAAHFPDSTFVGYDLCAEPLEKARLEAIMHDLKNVSFEQRDLTDFTPDQQFDFITAFDAIHDQARPDKVLSMIHHVLKEDGVFLMQDINGSENVVKNLAHPLGIMLYTVSTMHCMSVSLAQGGLGLGAMWGTEKATRMLKDAGFRSVKENLLEHDVQNCYFIIGK